MNAARCISGLGSIRIEAMEAQPLSEALANRRLPGPRVSRYVWEPPASLNQDLPPEFRLALCCEQSPEDGLRRFYPDGSFEYFINQAFVGGLALLCITKNLGPEVRHSYRIMWQFFQRVWRTREHHMNPLSCASSLRVSRRGRGAATAYSILPETLGLNEKGEGTRWNVGRLLKEGHEEARQQGISTPKEKDCVHYGLVRAASLDPLYVNGNQVEPLIRQALYESVTPSDWSMADEKGSAVRAAREPVLERSLVAIHRHLEDGSAKFDSWFSGPKSNFLPQIAKQRKAVGGELDRQLARRVLQDLGWDAYRYVADCLGAVMKNFQGLIPNPLTKMERIRFEERFLKQPHFGQLPIALFVERMGFLNTVLWAVCEDPTNRHTVAVLHRLLAFYGEMATKRRAADRLIKAKGVACKKQGYRSECSLDFDPASDNRSEEATDKGLATHQDDAEDDESESRPQPVRGAIGAAEGALFAAIAERVRLEKGIRCKCQEPIWEAHVMPQDSGDEPVIEHYCDGCQFSATTTISMSEFKKMAAGLEWSEG